MTSHESHNNMHSEHASVAQRDYYEVLGVSRSVTTDEINAAYKRSAKKHHPDRHVNASESKRAAHAEEFKAVTEAYEVLSNPEKRRVYDMYGHTGGSGISGGGHSDDAAAQAMFEQMFGMGANGAPSRKKRMVGGVMFVDDRGQFFQRTWDVDDIEKMRAEMTQGFDDALPTAPAAGGAEYKMTTPLPHGVSWEVRLVETDETTRELVATLCADGEDATEKTASLHLQRTFVLPEDVDPDKVVLDVSVDESGAVLSLTASQPRAPAPLKAADEDATTIGAPSSAGSPTTDLDLLDTDLPTAESSLPSPLMPTSSFAIGEEPLASEPGHKSSNRAARRRAKHEGLKAGFLNAKPKAKSDVSPPMAARQRACTSPVSVREDIEAAENMQVDATAA